MEKLPQIIQIIYGAFFCFAGIIHFMKMSFFKHFIPHFFNKKFVNYSVGFIEFALGLGLFFPKTIKEASIGIFILLVLLLPIHIWDLTKEKPAIGSKKIAIIRIPFQFVLMYGIYFVYTNA